MVAAVHTPAISDEEESRVHRPRTAKCLEEAAAVLLPSSMAAVMNLRR
jgi:hypothetical protein